MDNFVNLAASGNLQYVNLSAGTVDISTYKYIIISHAGWGTDNGGSGSHTCKVVVDGTTVMNHTVSHGSSCSRETCGGLQTIVVDNTNGSKASMTVSSYGSGHDIGGDVTIIGVLVN